MKRKQHSSVRSFPPITKQKALEIAAQVCKGDRKEFHCHSKRPENCMIVISRLTGKVFYDGSAGDEG